MDVKRLIEIIGADFYTGVPDSQLKELCNYLMGTYGIDKRHHIIAANEGNCVAIAAGYHLATGRTPVVYMQNSGEGNIINPVASLLNEKVYAIPCVFIIGWRGEPKIHDEPQHVFQGEVTLKLLNAMNIAYYVIDKTVSEDDIENIMMEFRVKLSQGKQVAFVVKKGALNYSEKVCYYNDNRMSREEVLKKIVSVTEDDIIVSTTGKASRELFEIREEGKQGHQYDFLTVGSMGHCSSIALGLAINRPERRVWCIDGDGAMLMHMGALAVIGNMNPQNMVHIVLNNGAHETVGGMPTVAKNMNISLVAQGCGYSNTACVENYEDLERELIAAKNRVGLSLIEIKCSVQSRKDLGRPTVLPLENKVEFMNFFR